MGSNGDERGRHARPAVDLGAGRRRARPAAGAAPRLLRALWLGWWAPRRASWKTHAHKTTAHISSSPSLLARKQDALALSPATLKAELQPLLRRPSLLKLGYCLAADLRALGAAIGPEGGGAVAVVQPALDLAGLHRQLLQRGAPIRQASAATRPGRAVRIIRLGARAWTRGSVGRRERRAATAAVGIATRGCRRTPSLPCPLLQAGLPGLSGLVQAQLGLPLDKSLQCSAWGGRPLAPEQLRYAATDAAVLLALLASLAEAAPPAQWPLVDTAAADGPLRRQEGGDGSELGAGSGRAPACPAKSTADPLAGWTEADVRGAAAAWGRRLEPGAARSGRSVGKPKTPRGKAPPALPILPPEVPWACGGPDEAGLPRFICDVMAEGAPAVRSAYGVPCSC